MSGNGSGRMSRTLAKLANKRVVWGVNCVWWDTIGETAVKPGTQLPCCPHCGSVLMELPSLKEWWVGVDEHEENGYLGYRKFIEWLRGKCFSGMTKALEAYEAETEIWVKA